MKNIAKFFVLKKLIIVLLLSVTCEAMEKASLLEKCTKKLEGFYQQSTDKELTKVPDRGLKPLEQTKESASKKQLPKKFSHYSRKPILANYTQFSTEWWEALFKCKGCEDKEETIDCKKLLRKNPQWQEVKTKSPEIKQRIMKRALKEMIGRGAPASRPCSVACAVCVGANANERAEPTDTDDTVPHTALHIATILGHWGIFQHLLKHGANPNGKCAPAHPLYFANNERQKELLREYGAKEGAEIDVDTTIVPNYDPYED